MKDLAVIVQHYSITPDPVARLDYQIMQIINKTYKLLQKENKSKLNKL